jgi:hypothetical protein
MSTTTDLLHELMGFGHFEQMTMTRDGLLIGQPRGSVGFDAFVGSPSRQMLERTAQLWSQLSSPERELVLQRLAQQDIPPHRVGIPADSMADSVARLQFQEKCA